MKLSINQRINFLYENLFNSNKTELGKAGGGSYQNVRSYLLGKNEPSASFFLKLWENVKNQINIEWYLTGEGDPMKGGASDNGVSEPSMAYEKRKSLEALIIEKDRLIQSMQEQINLYKLQLEKKP